MTSSRRDAPSEPSAAHGSGDRLFKALLTLAAAGGPGAARLPGLGALGRVAAGDRRASGSGFVTSSDWDPVAERFGALPLIFGTVVSSLLALLIAVPLSLGVAIFLTEFAPTRHPPARSPSSSSCSRRSRAWCTACGASSS